LVKVPANLTLQHFGQTEGHPVTRVWQKWRLSAPQTHLWLIKHWFSALTFVVKVATFAKPETVIANARSDDNFQTMKPF
jgi:pyrroloquinoline quinone (PQQ) biosynthesis protein C